MDGLNLPGRDHLNAGLHHLLDTVLVGAEAVPPVDQGDAVGNGLQHQSPIDGGIAATGDEYFFAGKLLHVVDKIIEPFSFKAFRFGQIQFARFEGAAPGRDHHRPGEMHPLGGGQFKDAVGPFFHIQHFFIETIDGIGRFRLFDQVIDQFLSAHLGKTGHVVDVLFGIEGGELAAELGHAFDHFDGHLAHSRIKGGKQSRRTSTDDGDVDNGIFAHSIHLRIAFKTVSMKHPPSL